MLDIALDPMWMHDQKTPLPPPRSISIENRRNSSRRSIGDHSRHAR